MRSQVLTQNARPRTPLCAGLALKSRVSNPLVPCRLLRRPILDLALRPTQTRRSPPFSTAASSASTSEPSTSGRTIPPNFKVTSPDGKWRVRLIDKGNKEEVASAVRLQTDGFHDPSPLPFLDSTFKRFFAAEVLSEMNNKLKYNPEDRFVCLVAEEVWGSSNGKSNVVGIVEISYITEKEVLGSIGPGTEGVAYIQSMAVDSARRRMGAASALLSAAEKVVREWGEDLAVLHVYQDNKTAVNLYEKRGFSIIFQDAPWLAKLAVRPRYLMRKNLKK